MVLLLLYGVIVTLYGRGSFGSLRGTKDKGILSNTSSLYCSYSVNTYYIALTLLSKSNYDTLDLLKEIKSLLSHYLMLLSVIMDIIEGALIDTFTSLALVVMILAMAMIIFM